MMKIFKSSSLLVRLGPNGLGLWRGEIQVGLSFSVSFCFFLYNLLAQHWLFPSSDR